MDLTEYVVAEITGLAGSGPLGLRLMPRWSSDRPPRPVVVLSATEHETVQVGFIHSQEEGIVAAAVVTWGPAGPVCSCGVAACDHADVIWSLEEHFPVEGDIINGRPSPVWHEHQWEGYAPPTYYGGIYEDEICEGCGWHRLTETHADTRETFSAPYVDHEELRASA